MPVCPWRRLPGAQLVLMTVGTGLPLYISAGPGCPADWYAPYILRLGFLAADG